MSTRTKTQTKSRPARAPRTLSEKDVENIVNRVLSDAKIGRDAMEAVAKAAASSAVKKTLMLMGVDITEPMRVQEQFHTIKGMVQLFANTEFQADLHHVRAMRRNMDMVRGRGMTAIVTASVTGLAALLLVGLKEYFTR